MAQPNPIPIIDLFAGPGGLGEGFASLGRAEGNPRFDIRLSIEKDPIAHQTLTLRSFFRQFPHGRAPDEYYDHLRGSLTFDQLLDKYEKQAADAKAHALKEILGTGGSGHNVIRDKIRARLGDAEVCVLLGGPPCQAYSLAGRSRNKGIKTYVPEQDHRHTLYIEYLHVIADHWPAVFVMENVKGMLSSSLNNQRIFTRIIEDLQSPTEALKREGRSVARGNGRHRFRIHSLVSQGGCLETDPGLCVVRSEQYGIPQARHRVILVGVRDDLGDIAPAVLEKRDPVHVRHVLEKMRPLRSGLSKHVDGLTAWRNAIEAVRGRRFLTSLRQRIDEKVRENIAHALTKIADADFERGGQFVPALPDVGKYADWYLDPRLDGYANHETRGHIVEDLHRYLFAACYAEVKNESPDLAVYPPDLLPDHKNVRDDEKAGYFADRFRVQCWGRPSTTVVSHISRDGHYYIHPDPVQCRSLTVREAARLQTFPDNYFFEGPRTAQYVQVGNAVPPLLAKQIAVVVHDLLKRARLG
jgi:DNA (cytosine-5)-methyltransferase 1